MSTASRHDPNRHIRAPRGTDLHCKSWLTEAAYRMLQNNLDAEVAERPEDLVVYGGIGRAARNWPSFDALLKALEQLEDDESLCVQSGKPVGVFKTHPCRKVHQVARPSICSMILSQSDFFLL